MKSFTIFVPIYNEEELFKDNAVKLVNYADKLSIPYEILFVSNGSTDESEIIGREMEQEYRNIKFIVLPEKGVGRAFKAGIKAARYEHIVFMDADLSADLAFIEKANILLDRYALVLGTKLNGLQNRGTFRKMGSFVFYISVLLLMGMRHLDYAPGAKAYRTDFLLKYFNYIDDFTSFVLNLTFVASIKKEPVTEISITCNDNRKSRFNLFHEAISKYKGLFSLKFRQIFGKL